MIGQRQLASLRLLAELVGPEPLPDEVRYALMHLLTTLAAELDIAAEGPGLSEPMRRLDELFCAAVAAETASRQW